MVAGALLTRTGTESLDRLGGLARRTPVTFGVFLVAALAISGVPAFSGFVSKGLITKAVESGGPDLLWWALVLGGVGTVLSFAKMGYYAFLRPAPQPVDLRPAPRSLTVVMLVAAVPSVVFGVAPGLLFGALPGDPGGFAPYATSELTKAALVTGSGLAAFVLLRGPLGRVPDRDVDRVLHPAAFGLARGAAATVAGAGRYAESAVTPLTAAVGALTGRETAAGTRFALGTALAAVAAGVGLVLLATGIA
jgi:multicomponent Na+:H+ antiporter subunit D